MGNKDHYKKRKFKNDLKHDSDFDLDAYLEEQSHPENQGETPYTQVEDEATSRLKNTLLMVGLVLVSVLWYYDWNPSQAWNGIFGTDEAVSSIGIVAPPEVNVNIPEINIPSIPGVTNFEGNAPAPVAPLEMSMAEYLSALQDRGYLEDEISSFSARQLYDNNVALSYLDELQEAGYLEDLSFVYISNYFSNDIPVSYLDELSAAGVYDKLSFVDVVNFYQNEVSLEYLQQLNEAGYLDELSFVYITNYYENGVTVEFLNQLKESGLYEDLNFLDVIDLFEREQGN